ncbi:SseB family protein [Thetidibacter halocola]|uniref:SseB family protein n=1 Tax=Thetidibacter halocola TaxID=2827239 RepID=A0A8J7WJ17_9RHOB|nr:SseB family protein [Thetidibacter halocola]MBS0125919.1 SseB family protein [Thetidibacter halocola]
MQTPIDRAHAAMEAAPLDDAARLRFYERLADAELVLMLGKEPVGDSVNPEIFDLGDARFVLAFDLEERLTAFAGRPVPYAALSGRALARLAAAQGIGLALNLEVAPSAILLPPEALAWLVETLDHGPGTAEARPQALHKPRGLPEVLLSALDAKLSTATGLARAAYLAGVTYDDGTRGHLLGITGAQSEAEAALAGAVNEALVFSGLEAGALDVTFLDDSDPLAAELARVALRFDLPQREAPQVRAIEAPGSDPDKPPRLR